MKIAFTVLVVAVVVWSIVRLLEMRRYARPAPPRITGPDDDPDFLRDLDGRLERPDDD